jgi:hypothetical protein
LSEDAALVVSAVLGGVVTAAATAAATWFITVRVERARRQGRIFDALAVVLAELESNRRELESYEGKEIDLAGLRDGRLTIGDWTSNKGAVAGLAATAVSLWDDLSSLYDDFHRTVRLGAAPPSAARVLNLETRLKEQLRKA